MHYDKARQARQLAEYKQKRKAYDLQAQAADELDAAAGFKSVWDAFVKDIQNNFNPKK